MTDKPVICAECKDTGKIVGLKDGNHLTCSLTNNRPIYGSKPKWCPKETQEGKEQYTNDESIYRERPKR